MKTTISMLKNILAPAVLFAFASPMFGQQLATNPVSFQFGPGFPTTANITVTAPGGAIIAVTPTITYGDAPINPSPQWLTVASGNTGTALQVSVNSAPGGSPLPNGSYNAFIIFRNASGTLATGSVPVYLNVTGSGGGSGTLLSNSIVNLTNTSPQATIYINALSASQNFTISSPQVNWLSVSPLSGTTAPGTPTAIFVNALTNLISFATSTTLTVNVGGQTQQLTVNYTPFGTGTGGLVSTSSISLSNIATQGSFVINATTSSLNFSVSPGVNWLSVNPGAGFTTAGVPITVFVTANPSLISFATSANMTVTVGSQQQIVTVSYTPSGSTGTGGVSVSTTQLTLSVPVAVGTSDTLVTPFPNQFTITSTVSQYLEVKGVTSVLTSLGAPWLSTTPRDLPPPNVVANLPIAVGVFIDPRGLAGGTYQGTINIHQGGTLNVLATVNVTLLVGTSVSPTSHTITVPNVPPTFNDVTTRQITISAVNRTVSVSVPFTDSGGGWLTVTGYTNRLLTAPDTVTASINPIGLGQGTYTGRVRVVISGQADTDVLFTLIIGSGTGGVVSPNPLTLTAPQGGSTSGQVSINPSVATNYQIIPSGVTWLTFNPQSGFANPGSLNSVSVFGNASGLANGIYNTTFNVTFPGSNLPSQTVSVVFNVGTGGSGSGTVSPTIMSFSAPVNGVAQSQFLTITSNPGTFFSISQTASWLTVSQSSGTLAATQTSLIVGVNVAGLSAGTYNGALNVTVGGVLSVVNVTLIVGGGGPVSPSSLTFNTPPGVAPASQLLTINSASFANFTATTATSWLFVSPQSGQVNAGSSSAISVGVNVAGLGVGTYNGSVFVAVTGQATVTVPVTLNIGVTGSGQVTPTQLTFNHQQSTASPMPQLLYVSGSGSFTASAATSTGGNWLSTSTTGQAPGYVAVNINPALLSPGIAYTGTVNVSIGGAIVPISVTANVSQTPQLRVDQPALNFNFQPGATANLSSNVRLTSSNGQPLSFTGTATVTSGSNWLSLSTNSGQTETTVAVNVNATGLSAGAYTGNVAFSASGSTINIPVTLNVNFSTLLNSAPSALSFTYQPGAQIPSAQQLTVTSTSGSVLVTQSVQVTTGGNWLQVTPSGGTTTSFYQVTVSPAGLPEGVYMATITVQGQSGGAANSLVIPVILAVTGTGGGGTGPLIATPTLLTFSQAQGGSAPAPQQILVSAGGLQLAYNATVSVFSGSQWLSVAPQTGTTTSPLAVSVNGAGLPPGTYNGSVVITSQNPPASTQVGVTFTITGPVNIATSPSSLSFTAPQNGTPPASQTINVSGIAGATVSYTVAAAVTTGGTQWLSVSPSGGTTPSLITVSVNQAGLVIGTYSGVVNISVGGVQALQIPVSVTVSQLAQPVISSVQSAASLIDSPVSGGMIAAIRGSNLGPTTLVNLQLTAQNTVSTSIGEVRVLFDGIAAPLVFVRNDILSCIVPYEISTRVSTRVVVEYRGVRSAELEVRVVEAAPAIFTANASGSGQGAVINDDGGYNGTGVPARRSQPNQRRFATVYITGEGQLNPGGVTGGVASVSPLRSTVNQAQVRIGGRLAETIFSGAVPTAVLGLGAVSFWIPEDAPTGNVPLEVTMGGRTSQAGVTMNIAP